MWTIVEGWEDRSLSQQQLVYATKFNADLP